MVAPHRALAAVLLAAILIAGALGAADGSLIGNGEIVTTVGPTGFHNGACPLPPFPRRL